MYGVVFVEQNSAARPLPLFRLDVLLALRRVLQAVVQLLLERLHHGLLDHNVLVVEDLDDELVVELIVDVDDDGLDRRVALDQDTCYVREERG